MTKDDAINQLKHRQESLENETARLSVESIMQIDPIRRVDLEEDKFQVESEIAKIHKIFSIVDEPVKEVNLEHKIIKNNNSLKKSFDMKNGSKNAGYDWYKKPVGIIGISAFSGILVLMVAYIFRTQLGIPL